MTESATFVPLTHEQADAKLAEMTAAYNGPGDDPRSKLHAAYADNAKRGKLEAGDLATKREFDELIRGAAVPADPVEAALSGKLPDIPTSEQLEDSRTAGMLRGLGLSDDAVREFISGQPTTQEVQDAAKAWKKQHLGDTEWKQKWLSGDAQAIKEMTLCSIILTQAIKGKAA
jgi:hypothetical protein